MGALVGGIYAVGKIEEFKKWMCSLDKARVFNLVDFTFSSRGLIKGDKVLNTIKEFVPDMDIKDMKIPYAAVATDILRKKEVVFKEGSIFEAIRASISIPTVLTPVKTKDGLLVDGGVVNNIPINRVKRNEDDLSVVVDVNADIPFEKPNKAQKDTNEKQSVYQEKLMSFTQHLHKINPLNQEDRMGYFNLITNTISLMIHHRDKVLLEQNPPDLLIRISHESCSTYDFYKAQEMVEIGRYAAKQAISKRMETEAQG
jgi:NTE family protein